MGVDVAIVVGHRPGAQGARSVDGTTEYEWASVMAPNLATRFADLGVSSVVVERDDDVTGLMTLAGKINRHEPEAVVSLHFNGSMSARVQGSEVLYAWGSDWGEALAMAVQSAQVGVLKLPDRGLRGVRPRERGAAMLWGTRAPAVIVEPVFGSERRGWARFLDAQWLWSVAVAQAVADTVERIRSDRSADLGGWA